MDKKLVIVILIAILVIVIVPLGWTLQNANSNPQNNTTVQNDTFQNDIALNDTPSTEAMGIIATVKGPRTAKKGQNITIEYIVSNKGAKTAYNLRIEGESIDTKNLGTLKAGETRKFTEVEYMPTNTEVASDYGPGTTYMNPFPVGGDALYFKDAKGIEHVINFSRIEIKLT